MTLCKYFQQGYCKFGSFCRFEHRKGDDYNGNQPRNRFGALAADGGSGGKWNLENALAKYYVSAESIQRELSVEAPQWILSAYAPGRDAPEQLFGGFPREQSFEEMRLHHLMAKASGNEQQALNQAQALYQNAQQQMQTALSKIQDAARFVVEGELKHPNRNDICRERTQGAPFGEFLVENRAFSIAQSAPRPANPNPFSLGSGGTASPFGGGNATQPTPGAFGQPSVLGHRPSPFAAPAFGQPAQPSLGFGQPSQPAASPFGQPSQSSQPAASSAFGQRPQMTSTFGQPSALGARPNPFGTPVFGQPAQPAAPMGGSAFGQLGAAKPNPFASAGAAASNTTSPFAALANSNATAPAANPFANANPAPSNIAANPFASNAFNQNNNNIQQPNPFGQQTTQNPSPFAQISSNQPSRPNPFATMNNPQQQQQQQSSNPFAQNAPNGTNGSAFGSNNAQSQNPFGQPAPQQQNNPFGSLAQKTQQQAPAASFPTGAAAAAAPSTATTQSAGQANPYAPGSSRKHPSVESYTTRNADGTLATFKGKPVIYRDGDPGFRDVDGLWTRIWFPDGPPAYDKDTELSDDEYDEETRQQWLAFQQTGEFPGGKIPMLPPPRDCLSWDF
ncbi:hypothetical protein E4U55_003536 [Claviceps digitariae]|nr:hypothetical protein E4U55_003536 [Claviceps digitariae]